MPKIYRKEGTPRKTMIYLEDAVFERLRRLAFDERVSMAELIRRALDEYLKKNPKKGGKNMRGLGRIFKRGSVFWIAYYHRGKEYRESSESENESQARKLLKKRLGEIGSGKLVGPIEEKVTFEQLADDLIKDYEVNGKRSVR